MIARKGATHRELSLRLDPAKSNQLVGLNWAHMFDFASIDWSQLEHLGAIAQLEERRHGMAEAVGSSPTSSTPRTRPIPDSIGAENLRKQLGIYLQRAHIGREFLITRRGRPYARLVPPSAGDRRPS